MAYTTFNKKVFDATQEPMFFGESVNVARYDIQKYPFLEKLIDKQLSFFWRPEEIDLTEDRRQFMELPDHEKHIFLSNLKYQTLLDSVQGRSPNIALLPIVSIPELETWIETWAANETVHSRSYTHIIRNVVNDPSEVFDDIMVNEHILKRAGAVTKYYDDLIEGVQYYQLFGPGTHTVNGKIINVSLRNLQRQVYLAMVAINVLEAIRFFVSFACTFGFAERTKMEGNAKVVKFIARDESLHMAGTIGIINALSNEEGNDWSDIADSCKDEAIEIFREGAEQEMEWADYLFKDGAMIGLNAEILKSYVKYITNQSLAAISFDPIYEGCDENPLPWMDNWLESDAVQVAPQETEISSYLTGQVDSAIDSDALLGLSL